MSNQRIPSNCSVEPLSSGSSFTGPWTDVEPHSSVVVACKTDAACTLYMEFTNDPSAATQSSLSYDVSTFNEVHRLTVTRKYYRTRLVMGSASSTVFELTTMAGEYVNLAAPSNLTIGQDADASLMRVVPFDVDVSAGRRTGYTFVEKFGRNSDIDTGTVPEDVWQQGGVYTGFPTGAAELVTIVSTSANDTAAGSGARTATISGLDADGNVQEETLTMNGTTLVDSVNTYTRVHRAVVVSSGASNTALNAGAIRVAHKTTTANIFVGMPIASNQSQVAAYTIPVGFTGYLTNAVVSVNRSNTASISGALWIREDGKPPKLNRIFTASNSSANTDIIKGGIALPALTDITIRVSTVTANNTGVTAAFSVTLVADS